MEFSSLKERFVRSVPDLLVAGFIGLGAFLRIYNFSNVDLWIDEYGTWWVIAGGDWGEVARRAVRIQGQSPFFYFLVKLSSDLLGPGPVAFRLPSILFGIGILGLAYPLAIRIFQDRQVALLAVAAFAVNEYLIFFSQDARPYSLALLCAMLSFLCYLSLLTTETLSCRLGYLLATAGVYYAHYLLGVVVVIQVLHLFWTRGWSWLRSKTWRATFLALALICLPGAAQVVSLFGRRETLDYLNPAGLLGPIKLALDFLNPWALFPVAIVVLAFRLVGKEKAKLRYRGLDVVVLWALLPIAFFAVVPPLFGITLLKKQYVLVALPGAILFVSWVMAIERGTIWARWVPLVVFVTLTFVFTLIPALQATGTFSRRPNQGWNRAAALLEKNARSDDLILYRVGFVEANQLALPAPNPLIVSFVSWPLTANLTSANHYQMVGLPFREMTQNVAYISSIVKKAAEHNRVWIIGTRAGEITTRVAHVLISSGQFQLRGRTLYGSVQVILLERGAT